MLDKRKDKMKAAIYMHRNDEKHVVDFREETLQVLESDEADVEHMEMCGQEWRKTL